MLCVYMLRIATVSWFVELKTKGLVLRQARPFCWVSHIRLVLSSVLDWQLFFKINRKKGHKKKPFQGIK